MSASFKILDRMIGGSEPCYIIAEAGVNHNGDLALAHKLIDAAVDARADAVKFQTFLPERLVSSLGGKAAYQKTTTGADESQLEMLRRLSFAAKDFAELKWYCEARRITFLSTPFEDESVDLLERLDVPAFKLSSGEITYLSFLRYVAAKGRPIILSTGMSTLVEVERGVAVIRDARCTDLALLHCVSAYPAEAGECNLRAMQTLSDAFQVPVGFSDHTLGKAVPISAAALGAHVIEKHLTLDRNLPGPDHRASLQPDEFATMVADIRMVQLALGDGIKRPQPSEADSARAARKSLVATRDLAPGTVLAADMIEILRPGTGIAPEFRNAVQGRRVLRPVAAGAPLSWSDFE